MINGRGICFFIVTGLLGLNAFAQDDADLAREKRLHQVYQRFNQNPTSLDQWKAAQDTVKDTNYEIQKGDTLWDISETFFGDSDFWPKLWALNNQGIFNPHEITPGDKVQFVEGTLNEPPSFAVTEKGAGSLTNVPDTGSTPPPQMVDVDLGTLTLPPPFVKSSAPPANPPTSLPDWKMRDEPVRTNVKMDVKTITRSTAAAQTFLTSYVQDHEIVSVGEIIEAEAGMQIAHENQYVTVRIDGAAEVGKSYRIVRQIASLKDPQSGNEGKVIQVEGELVIGDLVSPEPNVYRAMITRAFDIVNTGSLLSTEELHGFTYASNGNAPADAQAQVIGGQLNDRRSVFGTGEIVFLGGVNAMTVGQVMNVYRNERKRNPGTVQTQNSRKIGTLRVEAVSGTFASALILTENEEIEVGDSGSHSLVLE